MADLFELVNKDLVASEKRVFSAAKPFHINFGNVAWQIQKQLKLLDDVVEIALSRAVKKTARWLAYHSARELKVALGLKNQKRIRDRIKVFANNNKGQTSIWFGLAPIEIESAGKPRQNKSGVRVGGKQYDGAFYAPVYGDTPFVYIRASRNASEGHTTYRRSQQHKNTSALSGDLKGRFPVQRLGLDIEEPATYILDSFERRTNERFLVIFDQELNFELKKRGSTAK